MVWGGISARGLTKLHVVPNKTSITAEYYHGVISKCSLVKNQGGNPDKLGSVMPDQYKSVIKAKGNFVIRKCCNKGFF